MCLGLRLVREPLGDASRGTRGHEAVISWADVLPPGSRGAKSWGCGAAARIRDLFLAPEQGDLRNSDLGRIKPRSKRLKET